MQQKVFILSLFFLAIYIPFGGFCQDSTKAATADQSKAANKFRSLREKYSVHGTIKSKATGEIIIGGTVAITGSSIGTVSNEYGFYSLTLPQDDYTLEISAVGMTSQQIKVSLNKDVKLDILLEEEVTNLQEVTVKGSSTGRSLKNPQMSVEKINVHEVRTIPVLFGERDILKTIQLLPGIKSAGEGNSGFYTRGGSADQNLILLDEAPVYNASHLLGFFSTFNSDAIKDVSVYKGGMPAQYGGRLSSVLDIRMNDGNKKEFTAEGGIGLISSRLKLEGPIVSDKSSFMISARRTYADAFLAFAKDESIRKN